MRLLSIALVAAWCVGCSCSTPAATSDAGTALDSAQGDGGPDSGVVADTGMDANGGLDATSPTDTGVAPLTCRGVGEVLCGGTCVNTQVDPANCGGCGHACSSSSVCLSSGCATSCPPGLAACGGTCVDTQSDNANCSTCGNACPSGQGCLAGACAPAVVVGPPPARCIGGGPPIEIGSGAGALCSGTLSRVTFTHGLCACTDVGTPELSATLVVDGYDSTLGPYVPGGTGGHVGANGRVQSSSTLDVSGDLETTASGGFTVRGTTHVGERLRVQGPLALQAALSVDGDAYLGGAISGVVSSTVGGTLHVPACSAVPATLHAPSCTSEPISIGEVCRCDATELVPVHAIVAYYAMAVNNDDAAIGLDPDALASAGSPGRLDLPCGYYYLSRIHAGGATTIAVHGRTAVFIGGSIEVGSPLTFTLDPGGTLDVFVDGTVYATASFRVGTPAYPARSRFYVGGVCGGGGASCTLDADCCSLSCASGTCAGGGSGEPFSVDLTSDTSLAGLFYAANGQFLATSNLEMYGAIFARSFHSSSDTFLHYDRAATTAPDECPPPPAPDAGTSLDAGTTSDGGSTGLCRPGVQACGVGLPTCPAGNICIANCCTFFG